MKALIVSFGCCISLVGFSQLTTIEKRDGSEKYEKYINKEDLKKHLTVLASDEYEGRETGKNGQKKAAAYLIEQFKASKCQPAPGMTDYEQTFDVVEVTPGGTVQFGKKELKYKTDFIYIGAKRLFEIEKVPVTTMSAAALQKDEQPYVLIQKLEGLEVRKTVTDLKKNAPKGLKAIVLVVKDYDTLYQYFEHYTTNKSMRLAESKVTEDIPTILVRASAIEKTIPKMFHHLIGTKEEKALKKFKKVSTCSIKLNTDEQQLKSSNVLAYIPGSDPVLNKEIVVITAHYDHIGVDNGVVYNGADDDGTGTVGLIELAEAFMAAQREGKGPRRSILIMPVSGEEKGLLGSQYYTNHPIIPLENTIADLNIDMIGRDDIAHPNKSDYIYIIGSNMLSDDLHNANEKANSTYTNLELDYRFNSLDDPNQFYYRSDHYNFAKNSIPSIFYFSGVHEDYHQPTDDIEKINFDKVEKVTKLVFHTAWKLANETQRPMLKM